MGTKAVSDKALENIHTSVLTDSNATKKNKRKQGDKSVKPPPKQAKRKQQVTWIDDPYGTTRGIGLMQNVES